MSDRLDELIALATLGELSELEEAELDELLVDDAANAEELDQAMETAATLLAAGAETPPPGLRSSVLDAIAATPQDHSADSWVDQPPAASDRVVGGQDTESAQVIDLSSRRRRRWASALSAAAAVVLLGGVGIIVTRDDSPSVEEQIAAEAASVIDADDAVSRTLEGTLDGTVTVVYSPGEEALVIDGDGLPVLGEDRAFVLWFVDDGGATPVQIFRPDDSGDVLVRVDGVDPTDVVLGITEEDAGGADTPTEPILASA